MSFVTLTYYQVIRASIKKVLPCFHAHSEQSDSGDEEMSYAAVDTMVG